MVKKNLVVLLMLIGVCSFLLAANYSHSPKKHHSKKANSSAKKKKTKSPEMAMEAVSYHTPVMGSGDTLRWIEQQMQGMNDTQRIGQLFMMPAWTNHDSVNCKSLPDMISKYNIGGIIMMQGTPYRHAVALNRYQNLSKIPLLVGLDGEWGLAMRIDSTLQYPHQLTLGALQNDSLIFKMGEAVGDECKRLGIQLNFAPVVDVNNNSNNPIINDRSFGENAEMVTNKAIAYMNGMHKAGILSCAKHFPGHGDTDVDSHKDLPVLPFSRERLDSLELKPFKAMIVSKVPSIMVAHLAIPQLEPNEKIPASLSQNLVQNLLKTELHYNGLVITDAMNMHGVTKNYESATADVMALLAGNDMILFSQNLEAGINEILKAVSKNLITQEEIDNRVRKILYYKYKAGLNHYQPIVIQNLQEDLHRTEKAELLKSLYCNALTCINREEKIKAPESVVLISIGNDTMSITSKMLSENSSIKLFRITNNESDETYSQLLDSLQNIDYCWVEMHHMNRFASKDYGINSSAKKFIQQLSARQNCSVVLFGNPYSLKFFDNCKQIAVAYEDNQFTQTAVANYLLNSINTKGKLPVSASSVYKFGMGNELHSHLEKHIKSEALQNAIAAGFDIQSLKKIDTIALEGIAARSYPGCEIISLKDGKVIYEKSFGHQTYENGVEVKNENLYDLASITKIACTTLACMKLYEEGKLDVNKTIGDYLPEAKKTNKKKIVIRDMLLHQAGMVPFIPFWKNCFNTKGELNENFSTQQDAEHPLQVAKDLCESPACIDKMWEDIYKSDVKTPGKYVYSDLDLYFMKRICDKILKKETVEDYVQRNFYDPMNLKTMCFNPLQHGFKKEEIMPTERDNYFRHQLVWGYVHDQGAAMCGGIQGHAGLFSNAKDLAMLMQMLCNKGELNGKRYFKAFTVDKFTTKQSSVSRRGLGFDKQEPNPEAASPVCKSASLETFGHTGFTGTSAWADPKYNLVFVFLSNRVYPEAGNNKIITLSIRTRIQEVLYQAMKK